jgi:hypothetical protein
MTGRSAASAAVDIRATVAAEIKRRFIRVPPQMDDAES